MFFGKHTHKIPKQYLGTIFLKLVLIQTVKSIVGECNKWMQSWLKAIFSVTILSFIEITQTTN